MDRNFGPSNVEHAAFRRDQWRYVLQSGDWVKFIDHEHGRLQRRGMIESSDGLIVGDSDRLLKVILAPVAGLPWRLGMRGRCHWYDVTRVYSGRPVGERFIGTHWSGVRPAEEPDEMSDEEYLAERLVAA